MKPDAGSEGRRWLAQAENDLAFVPLTARAAPLDQFYLPTRYPNILPGGGTGTADD